MAPASYQPERQEHGFNLLIQLSAKKVNKRYFHILYLILVKSPCVKAQSGLLHCCHLGTAQLLARLKVGEQVEHVWRDNFGECLSVYAQSKHHMLYCALL